jgi:tRNA pseudouridine55 synthase
VQVNPAREEIEAVVRTLTGVTNQVPPPFSAKKVGGVPSYKLARKGRAVENAAVQIEVLEFEVTKLAPAVLAFRVVCSSGTYIRSLAHDLGRRLGCGAHLISLCRTRCGEWTMDSTVPLDRVSARAVVPMEQLLDSLPLIEVSEIEEQRVVHGNDIPAAAQGRLARIFNKRGEFLAIAAIENGWARPRLVLTSMS